MFIAFASTNEHEENPAWFVCLCMYENYLKPYFLSSILCCSTSKLANTSTTSKLVVFSNMPQLGVAAKGVKQVLHSLQSSCCCCWEKNSLMLSQLGIQWPALPAATCIYSPVRWGRTSLASCSTNQLVSYIIKVNSNVLCWTWLSGGQTDRKEEWSIKKRRVYKVLCLSHVMCLFSTTYILSLVG